MSWFVGFLKHIFGFGDGERKEIPRNPSQGDHDYHGILNIGASTPLVNRSSYAQMQNWSNIHGHPYENSSRSPSRPNREIENRSVPMGNVTSSNNSAADFANSNKNSVVASNSALPSSPKPVLVGKESNSRSKTSLLQSSYADVLQTKKMNQITEQKFPNNALSAASQASHSSPESVFSVHPHKQPSFSTKPVSDKSSERAWEPMAAHLSSSSSSVPQSNTPNRAANKLSDQKMNSHVMDAASVSSYSWLQSSSELFASPSDTEETISSPDKDPLPCSPLPSKIHSTKRPPISTKPTLSLATSSSPNEQKKATYVWVEKSASTYVLPDDIKSSIEKDIVPAVLKMPLSMATYKDYFHSLLYAEDYYLEKWDGFEMKNVTLDLHEAEIYERKRKPKNLNEADEMDEKVFVAFDVDKIPERRPFILSRDFVTVKPSNRTMKALQGVIYRVVKSNLVLAEFEADFHSQHNPACQYEVKFSFNRVCLKRAHHAVSAASDLLPGNCLFPGFAPTHDHDFPPKQSFSNYRYHKDALALCKILRLQGAPPYLVEGPISVVGRKHLSRTGEVITKAVLGICRTSPSTRILLCAPLNNTCDVIMRELKKEMAESDMFRANAAFREVDGVPVDILPSCFYEQEMDFFACPSLEELVTYKVILSTYISSFRLYEQGMMAGHFSHIFLVDNSSVTEPETMVPLANFVNAHTVVVVTGTSGNRTSWIRSKIARQNGMMTSYFERLRECPLYKNLDPSFIMQLEN